MCKRDGKQLECIKAAAMQLKHAGQCCLLLSLMIFFSVACMCLVVVQTLASYTSGYDKGSVVRNCASWDMQEPEGQQSLTHLQAARKLSFEFGDAQQPPYCHSPAVSNSWHALPMFL
jgi:hypothetical protein